ncbi:unnamed protein product [[Candida] boidinii]|nr:unnamed protein product [[Candida] boidinii]
MNSTIRACHCVVVDEDPNESLLNRFDFSMELTIIIPIVEQIIGIQSTNVTWTIDALTVLLKIAASTIDQKPIAYNAPAI